MKKYLFIAAVAVIALASCQKETEVPSFNNVPGVMNEISLRSACGVTKSAIDGTTFPVGYDMLVSAYRNLDESIAGDDEAEDYFEGIHFAKGSNEVWHAETPKYWPLTGNLDFLAIACAGLNTADNGIVPECSWGDGSNVAKQVVVTVPDNSEKFDDLLYGAANAQTYNASGTPIQFNHAMAAVVFTAKSNVAYNAETNVGITINYITVNGAKYSGTLTVSNPAAGGETGDLSAVWSDWDDEKPYIKARVWDEENLGTNTSETELTDLNLTTTSAAIATKKFGEAYVILPAQAAVPFTVTYTIHNGKDADGEALDNQLEYKYTPSGNWDMANKYVYDINITLHEITIAPSIVNWDDQDAVDVPVGQEEGN